MQSWESASEDTSTFTPDITPLILAAHRDNYEIIKILLDRGAVLPMPHDVRCGCDECVQSRQEDSLRHSRSRINAYRALASPSLVALSSKDPILTAFELSWELRRLSFLEHEFKVSRLTKPKRNKAYLHIFTERVPGAAQAVSGFCYRSAGSHTHITRAGNPIESRSHWTGLRAWRENAPEPPEVGH